MSVDLGSLAGGSSGAWSPLEGLGVSAGGSLVSGALGYLFGGVSSERELENYKKKLDYQNKIAVENAKHKYEYEVESLRNAGISLAGLGGQFQNAGVTPGHGADSYDPGVNIPDISQGAASLTQASAAVSSADYMESMTGLNKIEQEYRAQVLDDQHKAQQAWIGLTNMQTGLTEQQKWEVKTKVDFLNDNYMNELKLNAKRLAIADQTLKDMKLNYDHSFQEFPIHLKLIACQAYNNYQQGWLTEAQYKHYIAQCGYLGMLSENLGYQNDILKNTKDYIIQSSNEENKAKAVQGILDTQQLSFLANECQDLWKQGKKKEFQLAVDKLQLQIDKTLADKQFQKVFNETLEDPIGGYLYSRAYMLGRLIDCSGVSNLLKFNFNSSTYSGFNQSNIQSYSEYVGRNSYGPRITKTTKGMDERGYPYSVEKSWDPNEFPGPWNR